MVNLRGSRTPKKGVVSPAKQAKSPAKQAPKTPAKASAKSPAKHQNKTPQAPIAKKTPVSRKRELKQEKPEEEDDKTVIKKMKQSQGKKSLPAKIPAKEEPEQDLENSTDEESDDDYELQLNLKPELAGSDDEEEEYEDDAEETEFRDDEKMEEEEESEDDEKEMKEEERDSEELNEEDEDDESSEAAEEEVSAEDIEVKAEDSPKAAQVQAKSAQVKKEKKPVDKKPLHETTTILARGFRPTATIPQLKNHFAHCGTITSCKIKLDKKTNLPSAFIIFKSVAEAKCAQGTKNGKPFQGKNIGVTLLKTAHHFTPEDTVVIIGLPKGVHLTPKEIYVHVKTAMNKFGEVAYIKFASHMKSGSVQFKDNTGVAAALKAGHFELLDSRVRIAAYGDFQMLEARVTIFGLTDAISRADVESALRKHCPIVIAFYPTNTSDEVVKGQLTVGFNTPEAAEKILAMKTLKVKNTILDILPDYRNKRFYDSETKVYHRHPAGVFVESLSSKVPYHQILADMGKFGPVMRLIRYNHNRSALVIFERKDDAAKALETASPTVMDTPVRFHAVDGVYSTPTNPPLTVGATVYISNIPGRQYIAEVIKQIKAAKLWYKSVVPNKDLLSMKFKKSMFVEFDTEDAAKKALEMKITLENNQEAQVVLYDPAEHDYNAKNIVLIEGLACNTKEVDLWKSFQGFGEICTAVVLREPKSAKGYIQFETSDVMNEALKATNIEINGAKVKVKVIQPTSEAMEKLRVRVSDSFKPQFKPRFKPIKGGHYKGKMGKSPQSFQNKKKMSFKKKTF